MNPVRRLLTVFRRPRLDADMRAEMRAHLDEQTARNLAAGMNEDDARAAAHRQFGGVAQIQERARDLRGWPWLTQTGQDLRFAVRTLRKKPGFTAAATLVLALGIGLNTAMFSAVYALAFSPRPLPAPERLVQIHAQDGNAPTRFQAFSYPAYRMLDERRDLFAGVLAQKITLVGVGDDSGGRRALAALVSANYFDVLGVPPARGRAFTAEEATPGANQPVVIVSDLYWRNAGGSPEMLGSAVRINGRPYTIVGITPRDFAGTQAMLGPEFYFPLGMFDALTGDREDTARRALEQGDNRPLLVVGRLQTGARAGAVEAALTGVAARLGEVGAGEFSSTVLRLGPLPRFFLSAAPENDRALQIVSVVLLGLTGTVLLVVSLNLAGLLLVRGHARRKEFAIRLALGGTRVRLVRQLLTEGFVLALGGGMLGCIFAVWAMHLIVAAIASRLPVPVLQTASTPMAVVGATLVFCTLATLFSALGPALTLSRRDLVPDLQQHAGEDVAHRFRRWLPRHPLVVAQIALSLALLIGAGLFARLITHALDADPGIDADPTIAAEFDASLAGYDTARSLEAFRAIDQRLAALPGVQTVSLAAFAPYGRNNGERSVRRAGRQPGPNDRPATAAEGLAFTVSYNAVGADYFATLGVPLVRGRAFTPSEAGHAGAPPVAIIEEALAEKLWPGESALGRRIEWTARDPDTPAGWNGNASVEIVGITRTTHLDPWEKEPRGAIFFPFAQAPTGDAYFFVRSANEHAAAVDRLRDAVRRELPAIAPNVSCLSVRTFPEHRRDSLELWALRRIAAGATTFSVIAALIAVIGLYGAKAYGVSRRTREMGIRLALGAAPGRLQRRIVGEGLASGLLGIALGLALGAALGRLFGSLIVGLNGFDPVVFGQAAVAVFVATFVASWLPARQAMKVDPLVALRAE